MHSNFRLAVYRSRYKGSNCWEGGSISSRISWLVGWLWFNVTFSDISALWWRDRCSVSKFWPDADVTWKIDPIEKWPGDPPGHFSTLKNNPRSLFNDWNMTGGHFSTVWSHFSTLKSDICLLESLYNDPLTCWKFTLLLKFDPLFKFDSM